MVTFREKLRIPESYDQNLIFSKELGLNPDENSVSPKNWIFRFCHEIQLNPHENSVPSETVFLRAVFTDFLKFCGALIYLPAATESGRLNWAFIKSPQRRRQPINSLCNHTSVKSKIPALPGPFFHGGDRHPGMRVHYTQSPTFPWCGMFAN